MPDQGRPLSCPLCGNEIVKSGMSWHHVANGVRDCPPSNAGRSLTSNQGVSMSGDCHVVVCACGDIKRPMGHAPSDHRESAGDAWLRRARLRAVAYGLAFGVTAAGGSLLALRGVEAVL